MSEGVREGGSEGGKEGGRTYVVAELCVLPLGVPEVQIEIADDGQGAGREG